MLSREKALNINLQISPSSDASCRPFHRLNTSDMMNEQFFEFSVAAEEATYDRGTEDDLWHGVPVTPVSGVDSSSERLYPYSCDEAHEVQRPYVDAPPEHTEQPPLPGIFFNSGSHLWLLNLADLRELSRTATAGVRRSDALSGLPPDTPFYCGLPVDRIAGVASLHARAFEGDPMGWSVYLDDDTSVVRCYLPSAIADDCWSQSEDLFAVMDAVLPERTVLRGTTECEEDGLAELGRRLFFAGKPLWTRAGFTLVLEPLRALDNLNEEALFRGVQAEAYRNVYLPLKRRWCRRRAVFVLRKMLEYADAVSATMIRDHVKATLEAVLSQDGERRLE
ncbi:uncharacterized protein LOC8040640 [Ixodes scapularis]|uniref:uncharacterized protein LOC8040640 n=1 Tax=Ixodes scapularis TaxID=6945 RepID=UPI001A9D93E6|nr:uncharacterized protein LOC8040640 [Ixodes scapularis]